MRDGAGARSGMEPRALSFSTRCSAHGRCEEGQGAVTCRKHQAKWIGFPSGRIYTGS
jgi:hypothetical protein